MKEEKYRTLVRRFGASLVDIWPLIPFFIAAYIWSDLPIDHFGTLLINLGIYFVGTTYFVVMHARSGQTVGKRICGVRVVTALNEGPIGWWRSILREMPLIVFLGIFSYFDLTIFSLGEQRTPLAVVSGYAAIERLQRFWNLADALCTLFNYKRQSLHDLIGQTVVIKTG